MRIFSLLTGRNIIALAAIYKRNEIISFVHDFMNGMLTFHRARPVSPEQDGLSILDKSSGSSLHQNLPWNFILLLFCSNSKIFYPERTAIISWMDFRLAKTPKSSDEDLVYSHEDFYFSKSKTRCLPG